MRNTLLILILLNFSIAFCAEPIHIMNEKFINELYDCANIVLKDSKIFIIKDSRGIKLRFPINDPISECNNLTHDTIKYLTNIQHFLAKIENPAIIGVHTEAKVKENTKNLKNWEISTIIANKAEEFITNSGIKINKERINSVGYGEFLPSKNTPNNGGNYPYRVDIIILYNIDGE